ncbi:Acetyltransferase (GNAT) domain-containing protein [Amycolatopsis lurida]|uniref:Acetyltransferase n=1 Tax=Amycolatopsis lurida NRRL 2430 TaxID=1460371 RepID=A0A2P2FT16_AMYLU|nr:GNAT family N-acetyltransferase [Amycolatopsis lurida]KFU79873.1 acetyltransferase [Amycolatopsis lurida NRRL 2430]SED80209.1 Acetyltransferase (GNAT) domain-containing protein [Amycolatopsis lurida]
MLSETIRALQSYIRLTAAKFRETERIGPFLATYYLESSSPFLNYAIPDDGAVPAKDDVAALTEAFRKRGLVPRLEFLTEAVPAAEAVLVECGYTLERRVPLMICSPGQVVGQPEPAGISLVTPKTEGELRQMIRAQNVAFGEDDPDLHLDPSPDQLSGETLSVMAVAETGEVVGGGVATAILDGATEIAGIGVVEGYRSRGIAAAMTEYLTREAHARGGRSVFLTPGAGQAERVYGRVGFETAAECVHLSVV